MNNFTNKKPFLVKKENFFAFAISFFSFIIYVFTASRTVSFIDAGELATVASTLGIAHPTGYPLFTLLGYFVSKIPFGISTIFKLNLFSALLCSSSLFFFFKFLVFFTSHVADKKPQFAHYISAICGTLLLAFSETFWSQAVAIEVYSLHCLFLSLLLLLFSKAISVRQSFPNHESRFTIHFSIFAFILGLSFTNHLTTILLAPAFLYLFFATFGAGKQSWKIIVQLALPFLIGLSVYAYLLIRSLQQPLFDWGNPETLERFFWHVRGKQFSVWFFSSAEVAKQQFNYFLSRAPKEFAYVAVVFALLGILSLRKNKRALLFTSLLFVFCILYSINYDIHDIDSYFLLAYFTVAIWSAFGVQFLLERFSSRRKQEKENRKLSLAFILICLLPLPFHYSQTNKSENFLVEDYTKNMFASLDSNAIIISYQWDYFVSASYYFQTIEHWRTDVVVIDKELLRRSWYFLQLKRHYPWLVERSQKEIDAFLVELDKFEHNLPYHYQTIEGAFRALISSFISKNRNERPVYVTPEIEAEYTQGFQRIPSGLAFRLLREDEPHPKILPIKFTVRKAATSGKMEELIWDLYARSYFNQAMYCYRKQDFENAIPMVNEALQFQPGKRELLALKERLKAVMK
ncbi:MAG: DUF2723 domain-containing protein [Ignavibacteria bacterium]|nr:DUF2723 domain-containing protein [Ignavibacteria bacterium]